MRQDGYFWVKDKYDEWIICEWTNAHGGYWDLNECSIMLPDIHWKEIDENRIIRNENKESPSY